MKGLAWENEKYEKTVEKVFEDWLLNEGVVASEHEALELVEIVIQKHKDVKKEIEEKAVEI